MSKLSKFAKVLAWLAGGVAAAALVAVAAVYAVFAWKTLRPLDVPLDPAPPAATLANPEGARRLAILVGCVSCHGRSGGGGKIEVPGIIRIGTPNITKVLPQYTDAELARLIRFGVRRDNRPAIVMPSATFYALSDADLAQVMAYVRSLPPASDRGPGSDVREISFLARLGLVLGKFKTSAEAVDRTRPRWGELPRQTPFERGRYLASIVCSECHGLDLEGVAVERSPSLRIVAGYDLDQFMHLLRTGEPIGKRQLGDMARVATEDLRYLEDAEIADLYAFLRANFAAAP